jgi:hypothetical protein
MSDEAPDGIDWKGWCLELCGLLDEIDKCAHREEYDHVRGLLTVRFQIAENFGMKVMPLPPSTNTQQ